MIHTLTVFDAPPLIHESGRRDLPEPTLFLRLFEPSDGEPRGNTPCLPFPEVVPDPLSAA